MKRPTKPNLVCSIFVIVGLFGTIAHAKPEMNEKQQNTFTADSAASQMSSTATSASYSYAYPSLTSEAFTNNSIRLPSFVKVSQQPLLGIQVADFSNLVPNKFEKRNSIFEFAAKFNDKLQQVLAYFNFSSKSTPRNNEAINAKKTNREIHLSAQIKAEKKPRSLMDDCSASEH